MRDGVRISLCVYRPEAEGRAPALFAASPYQHEFDSVPAFPLFLWRETGPIEWYVGQGYAYVHADVRGSGRSEGEFGFMDAAEQAGLCRADRLDRATTLVQRPRRRHRPVLLRHGAMADGDAQSARPRLHRALRRARRPVPLLQLSRRHFLRLPFVLVRQPARRQSASPRRCRGPPADALDLVGAITEHTLYDDWWRERSAFERLGRDQGAGAVDRALGQDGPAPARQHPRLSSR